MPDELLMSWAAWLADSSLNESITIWLRSVPGLPPILQTLHLLAVAVLMGSVVLLNLRSLGLAVPSQSLSEMYRRLRPWWWLALCLLLLSALPFVIARPWRYLLNPVFQIKMALLFFALLLSVIYFRRLQRYFPREAVQGPGYGLRLLALCSLLLWLTLPLAGRWIAYSDYLFWAG